ncbi:MAG: PadR family transcriptional regulator [Candidatus Marsarchaeota archaeon]|nr:PadR family transcriptional regulator [Candidatus Marsarchaeota archaeon]
MGRTGGHFGVTDPQDLFEDNAIRRTIRRSVLKVVLLRWIDKKPSNPYEIIKYMRIGRLGHMAHLATSSLKNDIYNTLSALEKSGYIKAKAKTENGRVKKYYTITPTGKRALAESRKVLKRSIREISNLLD